MHDVPATNTKDAAFYEKTARRAYLFLPFYVLVPSGFWLAFRMAGYPIDWRAFGLGALGWIVALFLRGPLSALAMKLPLEKAKTIIIASSGVFEEGVRLLLIAFTSASLPWAISVGQGWAAVEVVYVMVNTILIAALVKRTDEKAMQAKQMLEAQGTIGYSPLWGIFERIWASGFHVGCTLIVAFHPWTVLALIPLHSSFNLAAVMLVQKSVPLTFTFTAVIGGLTLVAGLVLYF